MKGLMMIGEGLCFLGLIMGAVSGMIMVMVIPAGAGMLLFGVISLHNYQLHKQAESWRAKYPPYGY